jgi:hypothetical protein
MGREAECLCKWAGKSARVKALLEPPDLILRGELRRRIPFASMERTAADETGLHFRIGSDAVTLILDRATAAKWASATLAAPPSLAKKLGIAPGSKVRIIGTIDDDALDHALTQAQTVTCGNASLIIARVDTPKQLAEALRKTTTLCAEGVPLWIVYRKGPGYPINESDVRSSGLAAGIVDVKVASVSAVLTALKFVKRKNPPKK